MDILRNEIWGQSGIQVFMSSSTQSKGGPDTKVVLGDRVAVREPPVTFDAKPALLTVYVRRGNEVLTLREVDYSPLWSGFIDWRAIAAGESDRLLRLSPR